MYLLVVHSKEKLGSHNEYIREIFRENVTFFMLVFQGVVQLAIALSEEPEDHIQAAAAWALGQIGRHTPEHAKAVAVANVLPKLLQCYLRADASEDLQTKVSK